MMGILILAKKLLNMFPYSLSHSLPSFHYSELKVVGDKKSENLGS